MSSTQSIRPPTGKVSPASIHAQRGVVRLWAILLVLVLGLILMIAAVAYLRSRGIKDFNQRVAPQVMTTITDRQLAQEFSDTRRPVPGKAYEDVFRYLFEGIVRYRSPVGSRVHFPGAPSSNGRDSDGLEGFSRFAPLASAWLSSGHPDELPVDGQLHSVTALLTKGFLEGTRTGGPGYWGNIVNGDQRILEAGEIGLALWISKDRIWNHLDAAQKGQIAAWLSQIFDVQVGASNWSMSPLIIYHSLRALGVDVSRFDERAETTWERFKALYRGDGWFLDPPAGFDLYNSWADYYGMFWLDQIDPNFDTAFIQEHQAKFGSFFKHLFGPDGMPLFGRSVCYRMAAPAGLLTAAALAPEQVPPGEAMRAMDVVWQKFIPAGALRHGTVTQGYCSTDLSVVDNYSGPGSCQQGLRALTLAFWLDPRLHLFDVPRSPLPVEKASFTIHSNALDWTVVGNHDDGSITLTFDANPPDTVIPLKPYGLSDRIHEWLTNRPHRPDNHPALYHNRRYSTREPLLACHALEQPADSPKP